MELQRLELQRADTESKVAALRRLPPEVSNTGGQMALVLDALGSKEPDIRYAAIEALKNAAWNGGDIEAAIPLLAAVFEDFRFPSHLLKISVKKIGSLDRLRGGSRRGLLSLAARRCASLARPRWPSRLARSDGIESFRERANGRRDQAVPAAVARKVREGSLAIPADE